MLEWFLICGYKPTHTTFEQTMCSTSCSISGMVVDHKSLFVSVLSEVLSHPVSKSSIKQLDQLMIQLEETKDLLLLADISEEEESKAREEIHQLLLPLHHVVFLGKLVESLDDYKKKMEKKLKLNKALLQLKVAMKFLK